MTQVFISYSRDNRFEAQTIRKFLLENSYKVWIDIDGIPGGELWEAEIHKGIESSQAMVVLITSSSVASQWVAEEVVLGREQKLLVIPLVMQRFKDMGAELRKLKVEDLQVIDFATQDMDAAYGQLMAILNKMKIAWNKLNPLVDDLINAPRAMDRGLAAHKLGEMREARAIDVLAQAMLNDSDVSVRNTAAEALGTIGDSRAIPYLMQGIEGNHVDINFAVQALGVIGNPIVLDRLINFLIHEDDHVVYEAIDALRKIADRRAAEPLIKLLDQWLQGHKSYTTDIPSVLFPAVRSMADIRAKSILISALKSQIPRTRERATVALGTLKDSEVVASLIDILVNENEPDLQGSAIGSLGDPRAVEHIVKFLQDEYLVVVSAEALEKIGDKRAIPALEAIRTKYRSLQIYPVINRVIDRLKRKNNS